MKLKKFISIILTTILLASQFSFFSFVMPTVVNAEGSVRADNVADKYFYKQLDNDAKTFYDVMDEMFFGCDYAKLKEELQKADSKFGVDSVEITERINASESLKTKLEKYTKGDQELLNTMGAARDAYMADHAGLFYIDSSNISLRVTQDREKQLHAFLGIGRSETYINKAFWNYDTKSVEKQKLINALDEVTNAVDKIVAEVRSIQIQENQNLTEQQIKRVHDIIIKDNAYKLEETIIEENKTKQDSEKGDPWNVRTVYGAFGPKHEIVCEGFARAFKMVLDELNIPTVLVYGAYVSSTKYEEHMWNYVLLDDKWYGMDLTWDNTDQLEEVTSIEGNKFEERISTEYFLAGEDKMSLNHLVTGIMSVSNFEFTYPDIEDSSDKYTLASENAGLRVEIDDESYDEEDQVKAAKFKISYFIDLNENGVEDNGERMGFKAAREHGYYMVGSFMSYFVPNYDYHDKPSNAQDEGWGYSGYFGYVDEIYGSMKDIVDEETGNSYLSFYNANCNYIQFGITTDKPEDNPMLPNGQPNPKRYTYYGTSEDMIALSDKVYNPSGSHVAAPYIKKATPFQNSTMIIGDSYHCTVEYDERLVRVDWEDFGNEVTIEKSSNMGSNNYTLENFEFDGDRTITFDFKPSELYADDSVYYIINVKGLVGETSQKRPMPISYFCAHKCSAYAYKSQGIDWNVYGKPTLMDDVNLDDMTDEENADLAELLKHRMTLVTTTTKPSEERAMTDFLNNPDAKDYTTGEDLNVGGTVEKTETYNIKLTLCKMQKIRDGQAVRVMLGFPDGYGPEDAGVTFKAYHYIKDEHGNITGVEEIPCMVTELGLVIECRSFSPFTIAAVKGDVKEDTSRTVLFQTSEGGDVYDVYVSEGNEANKKSNKLVLDESNNEAQIIIRPKDGYVVDDLVIGDTVVDINGVDSDKVTVDPETNQITYTIKYEDLAKQNYEALVAKVAFIPEVTKQAEKEAGYEVVAQPISQSYFTLESEVTSETKGNGPFDEADEIEVSYKITDMKSVGEQGILGIGALLSYNREKLQFESITAGNGWKVDYNPADNVSTPHNLVATYNLEDDNLVRAISPEDGNAEQIDQVVFTVKFMVLENEDVTEQVTLSHIEGSTGKDKNVVKANDVVTNIVIEKVEDLPIEEKLEALPESPCVVDGEYVKNVPLNLTVADMKNHLTSTTVLPINYFKHAEDSDALVELSDTDVIGTGTVVKVGEKTWTIVVTTDLDGNGELTINDIVLFKLDYIGEQALEGVYLMAAEVDGVENDGRTSINDLVMMLFKYNDIALN